MPALSSWKSPVVSPEANKLKTLVSLIGILLISILTFCLSNIEIVLLITVSVFNPNKSNLISPEFSDQCMSNWVVGKGKSDEKSLYNGINSAKFFSAITTPAAWVAIFLFKPSSFIDNSISLFTLESFSFSIFNLGSRAIDSSNESGLEGSKGIILHN